MNTADLQLEGLLMAVAGLNRLLVAKGIVALEEIDKSLARSEQTVLGDDRVVDDLSPAKSQTGGRTIPGADGTKAGICKKLFGLGLQRNACSIGLGWH